MASNPVYPFGLPGLNQLSGAEQGNPLATSLEMMRSAMSSFGQSAGFASGSMGQTLNPQDLEKRIAELKVVENWLKLNLTMLSGSIQGMEVQLATIKTLHAFAEMGSQVKSTDGSQPSPLEIVLGMKNAGASVQEPETDGSGVEKATSSAPAQEAEGAVNDTRTSNQQTVPEDPNAAAAKAWWDMLQNQFAQMAAATAQASNLHRSVGESTSDASAEPKRPRAREKTATKARSSKTSSSRTTKGE